MVLGRDTFAGDVVARLGVDNVYADHPDRYPRIPVNELNANDADLAVLPDEPDRFTPDDGRRPSPAPRGPGRRPPPHPVRPSLTEAPAALRAALG